MKAFNEQKLNVHVYFDLGIDQYLFSDSLPWRLETTIKQCLLFPSCV